MEDQNLAFKIPKVINFKDFIFFIILNAVNASIKIIYLILIKISFYEFVS